MMPGIPTPDTNLADLVPPLIKGRSSPIISTKPGLRDGTRAGDGGGSVPDPTPAGILFETDFSQDAGFELTGTSFPSRINVPAGFLGAHATGSSKLEVL